MFVKTKVSVGIRGSIEQYDKIRPLLKAIDDQFVTSDKHWQVLLLCNSHPISVVGLEVCVNISCA